MAEVYTPWQEMQPSSLEDGLATKSYEEMAESPKSDNHEGLMAEALSIMDEQAAIIRSLTEQLAAGPASSSLDE